MTTAPTPPPTAPPTGFLGRLSSHAVILTGLFTAVGGILATTTGGVQGVVDFFQSSDQKTSQISAIEERLSAVEKAEKERLTATEKDRAETAKLVIEIGKQVESGLRSGSDVAGLLARMRDAELRLERLSAQIDFLREHKL